VSCCFDGDRHVPYTLHASKIQSWCPRVVLCQCVQKCQKEYRPFSISFWRGWTLWYLVFMITIGTSVALVTEAVSSLPVVVVIITRPLLIDIPFNLYVRKRSTVLFIFEWRVHLSIRLALFMLRTSCMCFNVAPIEHFTPEVWVVDVNVALTSFWRKWVVFAYLETRFGETETVCSRPHEPWMRALVLLSKIVAMSSSTKLFDSAFTVLLLASVRVPKQQTHHYQPPHLVRICGD